MEYMVKQYWNGIHWDNSYTIDRAEAERWKTYMENKNMSIWDRVNEDALREFQKEYNITDEESIEITVEIVEDLSGGQYMNTAEMWLKAQEDGKVYECIDGDITSSTSFHSQLPSKSSSP